MQKEWTITGLERALKEVSLPLCNSDFERCNLKAIHGIEIRRLATFWKAQRKLTPGEVAIAEKYGWKG